jgi:pimeloyl-ACP methyl ester carboxylesterase
MPHAKASGLEIYYETYGPAEAEPILLIMGLGGQLTAWPADFYGRLVEAGYRVILIDNRDVGLSEKLDAAGAPDMAALAEALAAGCGPPVAYTLEDMAADAAGVLDALGVDQAHIVGASMGGMIAQLVATDFPERTLSLTSIMSSTGNAVLPAGVDPLQRPTPDPTVDLDAYLDHVVEASRSTTSAYPVNEARLREQTAAAFKRCYYPVGVQRQYAAIMASPDRRPKLRALTVPTLVIHGSDDVVVPLQGGRDTAASVAGAELVILPGVGHELPIPLFDDVTAAILSVIARAKAPA